MHGDGRFKLRKACEKNRKPHRSVVEIYLFRRPEDHAFAGSILRLHAYSHGRLLAC
jgi:hypothetical protein